MITYEAATAEGEIDSTQITVYQDFGTDLVADFMSWCDIGKPRRFFRRNIDADGQCELKPGRNHPFFQTLVDYEYALGYEAEKLQMEVRFENIQPVLEGTPLTGTEVPHVDNSGTALTPRLRMAASIIPPYLYKGKIPTPVNGMSHRQINRFLEHRIDLVHANTEAVDLGPFQLAALDGAGIHSKKQNFSGFVIPRQFMRIFLK